MPGGTVYSYGHPPAPYSSSVSGGGGGTSFGTNYSAGTSQAQSDASSTGHAQSTSQSMSQTYIPEYSQTPILNEIAKYSRSMAPQVYQWGMDQFNKNQGNIDQMMKNANSYASPQRVAQEMGMAQAGVMQGAEQGRQNSIRDLQSYGIDPSSGRYGALDTANRTMAGAMAAGAGNQQRMATEAAGSAMQNQAIAAGNANVQTGYGASNAMNQLLGTGMQLKYSPLGTTSSSSGQSTDDTSSRSTSTQSSANLSRGTTSSSTAPTYSNTQSGTAFPAVVMGSHPMMAPLAKGGFIPDELSQSDGHKVDDVPANLTAGEFVIPKDVVDFKGKEFFYKLMAAVRKNRAMNGGQGQDQRQQHTGYGAAA
jgi:hypothetical protein